MDDLDHSIHIADNDWSSFFDESEECDLLQPSLACPDDSDLSDLENLGQQESQRSPGANTSGAESNIAEKSYTGCTTSPEQLNQNDTRGPEDGAATSIKLVEICVSCPGRNAIPTGSVHKEAEQDVSANIASSSVETKGLTKNEDVQTVSDLKPTKEPDLLPHSPAGLSVNEPDAPERTESGVGTEKERWFVTVNDNLAQRRGCSTSGGKKRKQKKACEGGRQGVLSRQGEGSAEKQGKYPSDGLSHKFGNLLEKSPEREKYCEFEDDLFSFHSCDSESCLSAAESVEEAQHPLQENPNLQRLLSLTCDSWTENAEVGRAQDGQMSLHLAAANCECYEITTAEPSITFLSCQRAAEMPDDNSTCGRNTCSETSGPQAVIDSNACSQEVYLSPLPAPDLPPTACSVADSPETYAKTAGNTKPVYAISAFWDEMEKLTINDILQVRNSTCSPPKLIQEAVMPVNEYNLPNSRLMDSSDAADSDYFTQPDESKQNQSSWELLTSDSEEDYWSCAGASANPSPDLHHKSVSSFLTTEDSCTSSEGRETPVPLEDFLGHFDNQESKKSQIIHDVDAFNTEDWFLLPYDKNVADLSPNSSLETLIPECFSSHTDFLDAHYQTSLPNIIEWVLRGAKSQSLTIYNPEEIFVAPDFSSTLCREEASSSCLQTGLDEPIPIFSCSRPTIRELTFPKHHHVFLNTDEISPVRFSSCSFIHTNPYGTGGCWRSLVAMRRICFPDKGRICCRASGIWVFPAETEEYPTVTVLREGKVGPDSSRVFTELEEPQKVLEAVRTTKRDGIFSTVRQSDMCLVCIAFASWVLRSSDPEAADAWKAALLANVSALSAIQYLRRYTTKKNPP